MHLHLINGFLGAGKTTAIITATRHLVQSEYVDEFIPLKRM